MVPVALARTPAGSIRPARHRSAASSADPTFGLVSRRRDVNQQSYTVRPLRALAPDRRGLCAGAAGAGRLRRKDAGPAAADRVVFARLARRRSAGLKIAVLFGDHWTGPPGVRRRPLRRADGRGARRPAPPARRVEECRVRRSRLTSSSRSSSPRARYFKRSTRRISTTRRQDFARTSARACCHSCCFTPTTTCSHARARGDGGDAAALREVRPRCHRRHGEAPRSRITAASLLAEAEPVETRGTSRPPSCSRCPTASKNGLRSHRRSSPPFGETTILRVGHAYERATEWHTRLHQARARRDGAGGRGSPVLSGGADQVDAETTRPLREGRPATGIALDD